MSLSSSNLDSLKKISTQLYFNWLERYELLSQFESPETIESVCYSMEFPQEVTKILERILFFLTHIGIFKEAGGTFSLKTTLEQTRLKWSDSVVIDPKSPLTHFITTGLELLDDRIQGGSSEWDQISHHFIIESVFTLEEFTLRDPHIIDTSNFNLDEDKSTIGIYGIFPQTSIELFAYHVADIKQIKIIVPTEEVKNQVISYCELNDPVNRYSNQVILGNDVEPESIDLLFIANGFFYGTSLKNMLNYIHRILNHNGVVYFNEVSEPEKQAGFEPLLVLHPEFNPAVSEVELSRMLKANGFSDLAKPESSKQFMYASKQE